MENFVLFIANYEANDSFSLKFEAFLGGQTCKKKKKKQEEC